MANDESPINKRRYDRAKQLIMVNYRVLDFNRDLGDFDEGMTASTVDLSAGGMLLRMTEKFAPKTLLDLRFKLKSDAKEIIVMASVVQTRPAEYDGVHYVAIEYPMLSDTDRALIDAYVKEINQRRA